MNWRIEAVLKGGARLEKYADDKTHDAFGRIDAGGWTDGVFVQGTTYWVEGKNDDVVNLVVSKAERAKTAEVALAAAQDYYRQIAAIGARTVLYMGYPPTSEQPRLLSVGEILRGSEGPP